MTVRTSPCCAASRADSPAPPPPTQLPSTAYGPVAGNPSGTGEMVALPGGAFLMGTDAGDGYPADGEGPVREIRLDPFRIDATAVTNASFASFVEATGWVTVAERLGTSFVFASPRSTEPPGGRPVPQTPWWWEVPGAGWRRPEGPGSDIGDRMDHPVVHVSWRDARAYAKWAGKRLPTEAEWEYAARGGLVQARYPWGDEREPGGVHRMNVWQGEFPTHDTGADGHLGTAPVTAYEPNGYGLYNTCGNVWEWCADWFHPTWHTDGPRDNPAGPPRTGRKVMRGGSYLCHESYCFRYRVDARSSNTPESSSGNIGFRCATALDARPLPGAGADAGGWPG
ncbi:formylglycine-generating enzyme family protein [Streptomyces sp. NPDC057654]|uniref:formylglycine-generating enzyme family protein n=1 Tax=Streptomyces sp. NPDC057654 TaxID=3346196 RepID=UPI003680ED34